MKKQRHTSRILESGYEQMKRAYVLMRVHNRILRCVNSAVEQGKLEQQIAEVGVRRLQRELQKDSVDWLHGWQQVIAVIRREDAVACLEELRLHVTYISSSLESNSTVHPLLRCLRDLINLAAAGADRAGIDAVLQPQLQQLQQQQQQQQHEIAVTGGNAAHI
jgi:hypothetical protein